VSDFNGSLDLFFDEQAEYWDEEWPEPDPEKHWVDQLKEAARKLGEASRAGKVPVDTTKADVDSVRNFCQP
jgi:hypothetical protein